MGLRKLASNTATSSGSDMTQVPRWFEQPEFSEYLSVISVCLTCDVLNVPIIDNYLYYAVPNMCMEYNIIVMG